MKPIQLESNRATRRQCRVTSDPKKHTTKETLAKINAVRCGPVVLGDGAGR